LRAANVKEAAIPKTTEQLPGEFLAEIEAAIDKHAKAYSKDARWHQFIVILSAASLGLERRHPPSDASWRGNSPSRANRHSNDGAMPSFSTSASAALLLPAAGAACGRWYRGGCSFEACLRWISANCRPATIRARRQARTVQHLFGIEAMIDVMKDL
jgi:hypothetical protein